MLGRGWHSTWHRGLTVSGSTVTITRADGRQDIYTKSGAAWVPKANVTGVLAPVPPSGTQTGWKLTLAGRFG